MKLIFLDIDGVLVTHDSMTDEGYCEKHHLHRFQKSCVQELNRLIKLTGAQVVISATCRKHKDWVGTQQHIEDEGVRCDIVGRTPSLPDRIRGHEIQAWIDDWPYRAHLESFVILDDDSDMDYLMSQLVLTSLDGGLQSHHVTKAFQILKYTKVIAPRPMPPRT
jgi:hypothetical protein